MEANSVVSIYEQMDVSLRHIIGITQGPSKAFQIAAIGKEVRIYLAQCPIPAHVLQTVGKWASLLT